MRVLSAYSAQYRARDEGDHAQRDVYIAAEGHEPASDGALRAEADSLEGGLLPHDVEEHDPGEHRAEGADVDADHVHPLAGPGLYQHGGGEAEAVHDEHGGDAAELRLLLQEGDGRLVEVYYAREPREEHGGKVPTLNEGDAQGRRIALAIEHLRKLKQQSLARKQ